MRDIALHLFGPLRLTVFRRSIPLASPSLTTLLGYIGFYTHGHPLSRTRLAGTLWPDASETRARRNLADALYRLRHLLGPASNAVLRADEETITLGDIWVDVNEFYALTNSPIVSERQTAIELYTGDLLEDIDTEWLMGPRADLRQRYLTLLENTCTALVDAGNLAGALALAHRWTLADSLNEAAYTTAMQLYVRLRRHPVALQQYERLKQLLADELNLEPLPETRALAEAIRAEAEYERSQLPPTRRAFIGRRTERATLIELAERTQTGYGSLVLVEGEAGYGKTRLLEEVAEVCRWRGITTVWGKARQLSGTTTFTPLPEALEAAIAGPRADQVRARLKPITIETLARLIPRFLAHHNSAPAEREGTLDLPTAFVESLNALATLTPHLLLFDDVQWADAGFWGTIIKLAPLLSKQRLLIVLAYRSRELRANPIAWNSVCTLDHDLAPSRLILDGLTSEECAELAHSHGMPLNTSAAVQAVHRLTGGSPLYLREVIEQQESEDISFDELLERRLAMLTSVARAALEAGAVLGREFRHGPWQALVGSEVLEAIPDLMAERFIEETEQGYIFQHDLTREYIYHRIAPQLRKNLHRRAGEVLLRERAEPGALAWQFEQAEQWLEAVRYYREAGEYAVKAFLYQTALDHYKHALALLIHLDLPQAERVAILRCQEYALSVLMRQEEWRTTLQALERAALDAGDQHAELEALGALTTLAILDANWGEALKTVTRAIWLTHKIGDFTAPTRAITAMGWHMGDLLNNWTSTQDKFKAGVWLAKATGNPMIIAFGETYLAFSGWRAGQNAAACAATQRALTLTAVQPELRMVKATALQMAAHAEINRMRWDSAQKLFQQSIAIKLELDDPLALGHVLLGNAMLCSQVGQQQRARQILETLQSLPGIRHLPLDSTVRVRITALAAMTWIDTNELDQAEQLLVSLGDAMETIPVGRAKVGALTTLGRLCLAQRRPAEALPALTQAVKLWEKTCDPAEVATPLWHAIAACRVDDRFAAQTSLHQAEKVLKKTDITLHNILLSLARFELSGSLDELTVAHLEIQKQAASSSDPQIRTDFINHISLHREIETRWQAIHSRAVQIVVRLAHAAIPLGKSISNAERVEVRWTVDNGQADAELLRNGGKAVLRQHRIQRLIEEAQAQSATPTDADLARALGVTERTIERDMDAIRAKDQITPSTRRRKQQK